MRPEALDSGTLGATAQGTAESFAAQPLPAVAEPQFGTRREWVLLAVVEVDQERFGGRLPDRDDPTASALAAPDGDESGDEVEVVELEVNQLTGADGVSNMSRMMASSRRSLSVSSGRAWSSGAAQVAMSARSSASVSGSTSGGS
jgi:hypothetical protein